MLLFSLGKIQFKAQSVKGGYTLEVEVSEEDLKPSSNFDFIPRLAARSMIRYIINNQLINIITW